MRGGRRVAILSGIRRVLPGAVLAATALCAAAGDVFAQEWKAYGVPLFASASHPSGHEGFVRVINHSDEAGEVLVNAFDDAGVAYGPVTLDIGANETVHFNSGDLERGNAEKGLSRGIGAGESDWRLRLRSTLDIEVLAYNRTSDGLLAGLHDLVPGAVVRRPGTGEEAVGHRVVIFNPASNVNQVSRLRIVNPGEERATVTIEGIDDDGETPGTAVEFSVPAWTSHTVTSRALESGQGDGLVGMLDDGEGKWRLVVTSDEPVEVMSLLSSPTGPRHLTNLSTAPAFEEVGGAREHAVPLFASTTNPDRYQGFVRIINHSGGGGEVSVEAFDDAGVAYGPVMFDIGANETVHFNSGDLEEGSAEKGLDRGIGDGTGDWRLRVSSDLDLEVLAYNRTHDGLLTTLHDLVPYTEVVRPGGEEVQGHHVAIFNPASNVNQVSRLRIINPGAEAAEVTIEGIDDAGESPGSGVRLSVSAGASRTLTSRALESGQWEAGSGVSGRLGDGRGKWRLVVTSAQTIEAMSLMATPTGHLVNLSTVAPVGEVVPAPVVAVGEAIEITGRTTASAGTAVALSVKSVGAGAVDIERYEWTFSDGQRRSGEEVSVSFADAGVHEVTVRAMSGADIVATASGAVAVFDAAAGANPGFEAIPALFGDVNQDERFSSEDLALAEQGVAGDVALEDAALQAGDLDLSGGLDARDVALMRQALDNGAALPSAILDAHAHPGGVVAMLSPALQGPDTDIEVFVGAVASPQVMRAILGYATFVVPASLVGEDAEVDVVVEVDGVVEERLRLRLKPLPDKPAVGAKEDVLAFLGELGALIASHEQAGAAFLAQNGGLSEDDIAVVLGGARGAAMALGAAAAELEALLDGEGGEEVAARMQAALYANGLAEFRAQAQAMRNDGAASDAAFTRSEGAGLVFDICDVYVPAICLLKGSNAVLSIGSNAVTALCSIGGLAGIGTANPALLAGVAKFCLPVLAVLEVARIMGLIVDALILDMRLSSDRDVLRDGETATIKAEVTFAGLLKLCRSLGKESASSRVTGRMVAALVRVLLKRSVKLAFVHKVLSKRASEAFVQKTFEAAVGRALTVTRLDKVFEAAAEAFCDFVARGRVSDETHVVGVAADARAFNLMAPNGGLLTPNDDDTGTYGLACPADFTGTLVVTGNKELCGENKGKEVRVACGDPCPGAADAEVNIPDAGLRAVVEEALYAIGSGPPITRAKMAELRSISVYSRPAVPVRSLAGLECATGLEELSLVGNHVADLSPLSSLPTLVKLNLSDNRVRIPMMSLFGLTALEELSLDGNQIVSLSLSDLPALTQLVVNENQITDLSLSDVSALNFLWLFNNHITDVMLSGLSALAHLDIRNNPNQVSNVALSDLPALTRLTLAGNRIADLSLAGLTSIERLGAFGGPVLENEISNARLSGLPALTSLDLDHTQLSELTLSDLPVLNWLSLEDNRISKLSLSGLPVVRELYLNDNQFSDVSPLSGLKSLERLELGSNRISEVSPLSGLLALKRLDIWKNQISDVSPLAGLTDLVELYLAENRISNVSPLAGLTALDRLGLGDNRISDIGPLVANRGLGRDDIVALYGNPLSRQSCSVHLPALARRGVSVSDGGTCR